MRRSLAAAFLLVATLAAAQDLPDAALSLGDQLLRSGAPLEAVTEYKRFLFFNPTDARVSEAHSRIAACLQAAGRHGEAAAALRSAAAAAGDPAERRRRELELVRALLAAGRDAEAELELLRLQAFSNLDAPDAERSLALHLAVLRLYQGRWAEADEALREVFAAAGQEPGGSPQALAEMRALLGEAGRLKTRSPRAARALSAFLPGAGQAYAGDLLDGLNALAVNGTLALLAVGCLSSGWYPEAVLLIALPLRRFYLGNIANAGRAAERRNALSRQAYRERILDVLLELPALEQGPADGPDDGL